MVAIVNDEVHALVRKAEPRDRLLVHAVCSEERDARVSGEHPPRLPGNCKLADRCPRCEHAQSSLTIPGGSGPRLQFLSRCAREASRHQRASSK
eukprot:62035-Prymnesium_polylepis.3